MQEGLFLFLLLYQILYSHAYSHCNKALLLPKNAINLLQCPSTLLPAVLLLTGVFFFHIMDPKVVQGLYWGPSPYFHFIHSVY